MIVQADDGDLLIADDFEHNEYAVFEDTFTNVTVKDYQFKRSFKQSEVIHLRYRMISYHLLSMVCLLIMVIYSVEY